MTNWSLVLLNKQKIRAKILKKRNEVSRSQLSAAALSACDHLTNAEIYKNSKHIACYLAKDNEFDLNPIITCILDAGKFCYLPKISNTHDSHLDFIQYQKSCNLSLNKYKIYEPDGQDFFAPEKLDLVLMPLVGFDLSGNRLGMGGGFYDRSFNFLSNSKRFKPFLLGVGFECQKASSIPTEDFDLKMNGMLTEDAIYYF